MQELIEYFKNNDSFYMYTKDDIIKLLEVYIEKEKEQIKRAVEDSNGTTFWVKYENFEDYYNKNYNQNK